MLLVRAGLGEQAVDDPEDLFRLLADAAARGFIGHLSRQIDRIAVHDGPGHSWADADAFDAHGICSPWYQRNQPAAADAVAGRVCARLQLPQAGAMPGTAPRKSRLPTSTPA